MALPDLVNNSDGTTDLFVPRSGDLSFDVEYQASDGSTITLTSADGSIRDNDTDTVQLDLGTYVTIVDGKASVFVPYSVTKTLTPWGFGNWVFNVTHEGGTQVVMEGAAVLRTGADRD